MHSISDSDTRRRFVMWFSASLQQVRQCCIAIAIALCFVACGGGSGSSTVPPAPAITTNGGTQPNDDPGLLTGIYAASRLASRASFGLSAEAIEAIDALGEEPWIDQQMALPATLHDTVVDDLLMRQASGEFDALFRDINLNNLAALFGRLAWWQTTVSAPDQLRQRIAYALSQIFVISDEVNVLFLQPYATSNYYDMLLRGAFGNFRELLRDVTLHPSMGVYLSHLNNAKSNPENATFPDENYAREVMQLFSIGLFELNIDGTEELAGGVPIATYDNATIAEFAKVFTGLSFGGAQQSFGARRFNFRGPMQMFDEFHDSTQKTLLNGTVLPAGQDGLSDIEAAVDNLFNHPNVGPFIGRQLIQRLVSSNPSPAYVQRVAEVFNDDGTGERGNMAQVVKAILLDPEARTAPNQTALSGKLREPLLRYTGMLRQLGVSTVDGFYANTGFFVQERILQHPLAARSVFNFYLPAHQPIGEIAELGLVAPEFEITNTNSIIEVSNLLQASVIGDFISDVREAPFALTSLALDDFLPLADDMDALLNRLDLVFTYGTLRDTTRLSIQSAIENISDLELRVRVAAYLLLISPDYAVEL